MYWLLSRPQNYQPQTGSLANQHHCKPLGRSKQYMVMHPWNRPARSGTSHSKRKSYDKRCRSNLWNYAHQSTGYTGEAWARVSGAALLPCHRCHQGQAVQHARCQNVYHWGVKARRPRSSRRSNAVKPSNGHMHIQTNVTKAKLTNTWEWRIARCYLSRPVGGDNRRWYQVQAQIANPCSAGMITKLEAPPWRGTCRLTAVG